MKTQPLIISSPWSFRQDRIRFQLQRVSELSPDKMIGPVCVRNGAAESAAFHAGGASRFAGFFDVGLARSGDLAPCNSFAARRGAGRGWVNQNQKQDCYGWLDYGCFPS
jgi:hypothetical protein